MEFFWYQWTSQPKSGYAGGEEQGFQRTSDNASTQDRDPTGEIQVMEKVAEHVGMNCPETPDS